MLCSSKCVHVIVWGQYCYFHTIEYSKNHTVLVRSLKNKSWTPSPWYYFFKIKLRNSKWKICFQSCWWFRISQELQVLISGTSSRKAGLVLICCSEADRCVLTQHQDGKFLLISLKRVKGHPKSIISYGDQFLTSGKHFRVDVPVNSPQRSDPIGLS